MLSEGSTTFEGTISMVLNPTELYLRTKSGWIEILMGKKLEQQKV